MRYLDLVQVYEKLEGTSKRLEKTYFISELLKQTPHEDLEQITLLVQGKLFPAYDEREVGVANRLVLKAISVATGFDKDNVEQSWKETGDLGKSAEKLIGKKTQNTLFSNELTVQKVFDNLRKLPGLEGAGTVDRKIKLIAELLTSASGVEAKYIVKAVLQDLRIGVGEGTMRDALVWAFFRKELHIVYDNHERLEVVSDFDRGKYMEYVDKVQGLYDLAGDFSEIALALREDKEKAFSMFSLEVGRPVKVMLYKKAEDLEDAFSRVGKPAAFEYKYDGFRMQIHVGKEVLLFTRRLENVTAQFPDVVAAVQKDISGEDIILDAEIIGIDTSTGKFRAFQEISQRIKRKYDIEEMVKKVPVVVNVFDILCYKGENLLQKPYSERRKIIEDVVSDGSRITKAKHIITSSMEEANAFYQQSLQLGHEGIMGKALDKPYKPGSRVGYGVKVKPVMETLDLVIVGAEWGEGKRSSWLSSFVLACRKGDAFVEIGRVGTGIKELEQEGVTFQQLTDLLKPLVLSEKGKFVTVKPELVVEVNYEEIQKSPTYSSGYALRFPRVVRLKEDRTGQDISNIELVEELYDSQRGR